MTKQQTKTPYLFRRKITPEQHWIRRNFICLKKCPGPHSFEVVLMAPEKAEIPQAIQAGNPDALLRCDKCKGIAWARDVFWYQCGLEHSKS